jgi:hypothetical protein
MVAIPPPDGGVYRIARVPNEPFALPDWDWAGDEGTFGNRFDDPGASLDVPPENRFRVLYCATQRQATFGEITARFRPGPHILKLLADIEDEEEPIDRALLGIVDPAHLSHGLLQHEWLQRRRIGHTRIVPDTEFVDVAHADTLAHLNVPSPCSWTC